MRRIITLAEALSSGVRPAELRSVAEWHGRRSSKKHKEAESKLRAVAAELETALKAHRDAA